MTRRLVPLALMAFAVAYLWQALAIPLDSWSAAETINARSLPTIYGIGLLVLALVSAIRPPPRSLPEVSGSRRRWLSLAAHCAAIAGFGVLIPLAGLWIAVAALLLATLVIAGERRPTVLVLAPLGTAATAWLLIAVILDIYIDPGRWLS